MAAHVIAPPLNEKGSHADSLGGPSIVLVRPQLGENIGMVARAMRNCGLMRLLIVSPQCSWPDSGALRASAGAEIVLERAQIFDCIENACAGYERIFGVLGAATQSEFGNQSAANSGC